MLCVQYDTTTSGKLLVVSCTIDGVDGQAMGQVQGTIDGVDGQAMGQVQGPIDGEDGQAMGRSKALSTE